MLLPNLGQLSLCGIRLVPVEPRAHTNAEDSLHEFQQDGQSKAMQGQTLHKAQQDAWQSRSQLCDGIQVVIPRAMLAATHRSHQRFKIICFFRRG